MVADNGSISTGGNWSIHDDDNSNDDSNPISDIDFNSALSSAHFSELTEVWAIVSQTGTKIDLSHVCSDNCGTENLAFEMK